MGDSEIFFPTLSIKQTQVFLIEDIKHFSDTTGDYNTDSVIIHS